jgi:two-component system OmpR family response regulator
MNTKAGAPLRVLCVEDEDDIRFIVRTALEELGGLEVQEAGSGPEALKRLESFIPDIILLDIMMPGMDGMATFRAIRSDSRWAGCPIVFMTAKVQCHEIAQYKQAGALDVIEKPFDPSTLADTVRALWAISLPVA